MQIVEFINQNMGMAVSVALVFIELLMRIIKTQEPKSLLTLVAKYVRMAADILVSLSNVLDGVLQRLSDDKKP
jgi:hypothetical protein